MRRLYLCLALAGLIVGGVPALARGHCDSMDGPVVKAAERALSENVVDHVLIWVPAADEPAVRAAFERARQVRALSTVARELADQYFFELVVRLHRASEGAPYTGLKPAGLDIGPAVPAADTALETGSSDALLALIQKELRAGLEAHFHAAVEKKGFATSDINAGREFVKAYVEYVHYVERLYEATKTAAHGHYETVR